MMPSNGMERNFDVCVCNVMERGSRARPDRRFFLEWDHRLLRTLSPHRVATLCDARARQ